MSIQARRNMKKIFLLEKPDGIFTTTCDEAKEETIRYFKNLLGSSSDHHYPGQNFLRTFVHKRVPEAIKGELDRIPTDLEIKNKIGRASCRERV